MYVDCLSFSSVYYQLFRWLFICVLWNPKGSEGGGNTVPLHYSAAAAPLSSCLSIGFLCKAHLDKGFYCQKWLKAFSFFLPQVLKKSVIIGVIEGGDVMEERLRSARETAKRPVGGFLLDGFHGNPTTLETRLHLLSSVTAELPEDKPRLVSSQNAGQAFWAVEQEYWGSCIMQSIHGHVF